MINVSFIKELARTNYLVLEYERFLTFHYSKFLKDGSNVLDIGANKGEHTMEFVDLIGKDGTVIAFEPIPEMYERLNRIFSPFNNVLCLEMALGSEDKTSQFVKATHTTGHVAESGIKQRIYNDPDNMTIENIDVEIRTLDSLDIKKKIDYIKIDTEGGEIDILNGARELINRDRPIISVEYGSPSYSVYGYTIDTLWNLSKELEYTIYDIFLNEIDTKEKWESTDDSFYWDYLLVPNEKNEDFKITMNP